MCCSVQGNIVHCIVSKIVLVFVQKLGLQYTKKIRNIEYNYKIVKKIVNVHNATQRNWGQSKIESKKTDEAIYIMLKQHAVKKMERNGKKIK